MRRMHTPPATALRGADAVAAVDRAVSDLRRGAAVVLHVPGGGAALVLAAELVAPDSLARLTGLAGSRPVLAVTGPRAQALGMTGRSAPVHSLALPPDATADLVRRLADPTTGPAPGDAGRPAPWVAAVAEGESSLAADAVRLTKHARLLPAVLIALLPPREDVERLRSWARVHGLLVVEASAIADYPAETAARLAHAAEAPVPLADAEDARLVAFRPHDGGTEHLAILIGAPRPGTPVLARLHSQCLTGDLLASLRCDCGEQLRGAIRQIAASGAGVLVYLAQEGRDIGLINKLRAYRLQDDGLDTVDANGVLGFDMDERVFRPAAEILRQLGFATVRLMTNNPEKIEALERCGIAVAERVPLTFPSNPHNARYLATKAARAGHLL